MYTCVCVCVCVLLLVCVQANCIFYRTIRLFNDPQRQAAHLTPSEYIVQAANWTASPINQAGEVYEFYDFNESFSKQNYLNFCNTKNKKKKRKKSKI